MGFLFFFNWTCVIPRVGRMLNSIYLFIWKYMKSQEIFQSPLIYTGWHHWKQEAYLRYWPRTVLLKSCEPAPMISEIRKSAEVQNNSQGTWDCNMQRYLWMRDYSSAMESSRDKGNNFSSFCFWSPQAQGSSPHQMTANEIAST